MGSWEYRDFLTNNASQVRQNILNNLEDQVKCNKCSDNTVLPVKTIMNCSQDSCTYKMNDQNGLGQGTIF